jgi:hypothetical protein
MTEARRGDGLHSECHGESSAIICFQRQSAPPISHSRFRFNPAGDDRFVIQLHRCTSTDGLAGTIRSWKLYQPTPLTGQWGPRSPATIFPGFIPRPYNRLRYRLSSGHRCATPSNNVAIPGRSRKHCGEGLGLLAYRYAASAYPCIVLASPPTVVIGGIPQLDRQTGM